MPSHNVHETLDALMFGSKKAKELRLIHDAMDAPVKLMGPGHRRLFHDAQTTLALGILTRDEKVLVSAAGHIALDKGISHLSRALRRMMLEGA